jgi:hypothetical protein
MTKKLSEIFTPRPKDERNFVAKHGSATFPNIYAQKSPAGKEFVAKLKVDKTTDKSPATDNDARFKATNIKTFPRSKNRFGYDVGADEKAYGVGGVTPGQNDQGPAPSNGSAIYPSGTFAKEDTAMKRLGHKLIQEEIELTDDEIDDLLDLLGEIILRDSK